MAQVPDVEIPYLQNFLEVTSEVIVIFYDRNDPVSVQFAQNVRSMDWNYSGDVIAVEVGQDAKTRAHFGLDALPTAVKFLKTQEQDRLVQPEALSFPTWVAAL